MIIILVVVAVVVLVKKPVLFLLIITTMIIAGIMTAFPMRYPHYRHDQLKEQHHHRHHYHVCSSDCSALLRFNSVNMKLSQGCWDC